MNLSLYNLKNIPPDHIAIPEEQMLELPEKVLQFGTGMLLRGLPDYYIDKANRLGIFNGKIVVVKSTSQGDASAFEKQDCLYTICERGVSGGEHIELNTVCSAISRVLIAQNDWEEILTCAHNPEISIIISNTSEAGIRLVNDDIRRFPPVSYPGKLLAVLYERFIACDGKEDCGFIIIPTELLPDNGKELESIVLELAHLNGLDETFIEWLEKANHFCNSVVDRIVSGMPTEEEKRKYFRSLGYKDELLTVTEVYSLWAIEGDEKIKEKLSFGKVCDGVRIEPNIHLYSELKLRLLNGTQTLVGGIALLSGIATVKDAMEHENMSGFLESLMHSEIAPSILMEISVDITSDFTRQVLDRFRNPHIIHYWKIITKNYSQKLKLWCLPLLLNHYKRKAQPPDLMAFGFAAYFTYVKALKEECGKYFGKLDDEWYLIEDERAGVFYSLWKNFSINTVVKKILDDKSYWQVSLSSLPGFYEGVLSNMKLIEEKGMRKAVEEITKQEKVFINEK